MCIFLFCCVYLGKHSCPIVKLKHYKDKGNIVYCSFILREKQDFFDVLLPKDSLVFINIEALAF